MGGGVWTIRHKHMKAYTHEAKKKKKKQKKKAAAVSESPGPKAQGNPLFLERPPPRGELQLFVPLNEGLIAALGLNLGPNWFPGVKIGFPPPQFPPQQTRPETHKREKAGGGPKRKGTQTPHFNLLFAPPPGPPFSPLPRKTPAPGPPPVSF
eukprot:FR744301.1.p2 GENE.FR744301.1~~FR744301.1.p2  ORF type:complete len:152 (+),score=77.31 FR744301.1:739-1194(+)